MSLNRINRLVSTKESDYVFYEVRNKLVNVKFSLKPVFKGLHKHKCFSVLSILTCIFEKKKTLFFICAMSICKICFGSRTRFKYITLRAYNS